MITATGKFTPTGGTEEDLTVVTTSNSVSANITPEMKNTGGTIAFTIGIEEDNTLTENVTYEVIKVLNISLSELSKNGNIISGTVSTNDDDYTVSAELDGTPVDGNLIAKSGNTVSIDASSMTTGILTVTVACENNSSVSDSETYTFE